MSFASDLKAYHQFHTKLITKITHFIGIPLILFSTLLFFGWIHIRVPNIFDLPMAWLLSLIIGVYYLFLDFILGATMAIVLVLLNLISGYFSQPVPTMLGLKIFLITFILGWILQFIGHLFESKKPAFLSSIKALLIAPIYLVAEVYFHFGMKKELQEKMDQDLS